MILRDVHAAEGFQDGGLHHRRAPALRGVIVAQRARFVHGHDGVVGDSQTAPRQSRCVPTPHDASEIRRAAIDDRGAGSILRRIRREHHIMDNARARSLSGTQSSARLESLVCREVAVCQRDVPVRPESASVARGIRVQREFLEHQ